MLNNYSLICVHINMLQFITCLFYVYTSVRCSYMETYDWNKQNNLLGLSMSFIFPLTFSFTWQDSTCSRSRRYSRRHWLQPRDSWEISMLFYELRTLFKNSSCKYSSTSSLDKRILLISSKRYPGHGASSSAVAFMRVGICGKRRKRRKWEISHLR